MSDILVSSKAMIVRKEKFPILKQTRPSMYYWDLPGGKLKYGETPEQALLREVKEETSISINIVKLLGVWWFLSPTNKHQVICITYLCNSQSGNVDLSQNTADENIKEYVWIAKNEFLHGNYKILNESLKSVIARF